MPETFTCVIGSGDGVEMCRGTFTADEWDTLQEFVRCAEVLREASDIDGRPAEMRFSLASDEDGVTYTSVGLAPARTWDSWLLRLRPFILQNERTYFGKVKNLLKRRFEHDVVRQWLDTLAARFAREPSVTFVVDGHAVNTQDAFMDWLNGYAYHGDATRRKRFSGVSGDDYSAAFVDYSMQEIAVDKSIAIFKLAALVAPVSAPRSPNAPSTEGTP